MERQVLSPKKITVIDPVGIKAGMDLYDINLCLALKKTGTNVILCSNFKNIQLKSFEVFNISSKTKIAKIKNIVFGHLKAFYFSKKHKTKSIVLHSFSFELKDLFVMVMAKIFVLRIILVLHDVSGFASKDNRYIRVLILKYLVNRIVVHNKFSQQILFKSSKEIIKKKTVIIKHGSFTENSFTKYSKKEALSQLRLNKNFKYILFFGQIKKVKGLDILLNAVALTKRADLKLIIAGKPWEDSFRKYDKLIKKLDISDKLVRYVEYISSGKRDLLFSACEFIILPYKKIYQSGVLLMTMSNKIPVIASDLEPFKEIIDINNGILFKKNDPKDLADKIDFALKNNDLLKQYAKNAYFLMESEFSWDKIAKQYNKFL